MALPFNDSLGVFMAPVPVCSTTGKVSIYGLALAAWFFLAGPTKGADFSGNYGWAAQLGSL